MELQTGSKRIVANAGPAYIPHSDLPEKARQPFAVVDGPRVVSFHPDKKSAVAGAAKLGSEILDFSKGSRMDKNGKKTTTQSPDDYAHAVIQAAWRGGHEAAVEYADGYKHASEIGLDKPGDVPPHEIRLSEFIGDDIDSGGILKRQHRGYIDKALSLGKGVPDAVLKDHGLGN